MTAYGSKCGWWGAGAACLLGAAAAVAGGGGSTTWTDPRWDNSPRRTDSTNNGPLIPGARLPDLLSVTLSAWQSPTASTNPYNGSVVSGSGPFHLFRLDVVFDGLVNPPGRMGDNSTFPYEPAKFGDHPVLGFLEIDVDEDKSTGGELGPAAASRYLANVARFGRLPKGSIGERAAIWGTDLQLPFAQSPQFRRSGADFVLSLCGCYNPEIISEGGNGNQRFDAGETWIVRAPFFQRSGGYTEASFAFGGSSGMAGTYDPQVNLRFSHSTLTDRTTITLVYALTMIGAGQLAGQPPQGWNFNVADQTSVYEGLRDVVEAAPFVPFGTPAYTLSERWIGRNVNNYLDPAEWEVFALFGTAYETPQDGAYVWTDTGVNETPGDVDGSGTLDGSDKARVRQKIVEYDAGPLDGDGYIGENGSVQIIGFGANFCLYDIDGNGLIDDMDVRTYCIGDFNLDGRLNIQDFTAFLNAFNNGETRVDLNHNGMLEIGDFAEFLNAFNSGCL
jgi:hypothetical protein